MTFSGQFIIELDDLENAPEDIDSIAIPFSDCTEGLLSEGALVYVPIHSTVGRYGLVELVVDGPPTFMGKWNIPCTIGDTVTLGKLLNYLSSGSHAQKDGRRLCRTTIFSMKTSI